MTGRNSPVSIERSTERRVHSFIVIPSLAESLDEFPQYLLGAFAEIALPFLAEERSEFGLGDDKLRALEDIQDLVVAQSQGDPKLFQNFVGGKKFQRFRSGAIGARPAFFNDEAIQKPAQSGV